MHMIRDIKYYFRIERKKKNDFCDRKEHLFTNSDFNLKIQKKIEFTSPKVPEPFGGPRARSWTKKIPEVSNPEQCSPGCPDARPSSTEPSFGKKNSTTEFGQTWKFE